MIACMYPPRRFPVMGRGGMVASTQPLASAAGLEILTRGGNAADAAVAIAAALNVTEPTSTGIGGDMFALYFDGSTRQVSAINGSGRAPAALTLELLRKHGLSELPAYHPLTVTVPGACAGWCDLVERHGSLDLPAILAPAIRLAEAGFPVEPITSHFWQKAADRQLKSALNGRELTIRGRGPGPGEIFRNPNLAKTFRLLAKGGKDAFYRGEIGEAMISTLHQAGGCMELDDLAVHASTWEKPISTTYRGLRLWECPPNGQGITALIALNLLERFELPTELLGADRLHLEIEALRLAFADARWYVADPSYRSGGAPASSQSYEWLLSKAYAASRSSLIDPRKAILDQQRGTPLAGSDTVYFCVVDGWGNACSFINSNYMGFGTGIVPSGYGFSLQNRGCNFSLEPGHPNVLAGGKRPYHTIIPAMITREPDASLFGAMGVMGGFMQPQGHLQVFLALAQGLDPQAALDMPRFCIGDGTAGGEVELEAGIPRRTVTSLAERGHAVRRVTGWNRALFGRGQVILRDPISGILTGGSDPRGDGCAMAVP